MGSVCTIPDVMDAGRSQLTCLLGSQDGGMHVIKIQYLGLKGPEERIDVTRRVRLIWRLKTEDLKTEC